MFQQTVKRLIIDSFIFFAMLINLYFLYSQMLPFAKAAITLNYVNGQTVLYMAYSILLFLLPLVLLLSNIYPSKAQVLRMLFYSFAAVITIGTVSDLITYNFFVGYSFREGDTVFVNIMWNIPNILGVLLSGVIAILYVFLGKWIKRRRTISYFLYLAIFILSLAIPFAYAFFINGMAPRGTWIQKAAFVYLEQFFILVSLTICASSRSIWSKHIWAY